MKRIIRRTLALAIALMLAMPFTVGLADEGLPCVDVEADASAVEAAGEPSGDAAEDAPADIDAAEDGLSLEDAITIEAEMPDASEESAVEEAANALFEGQESIIYLDAAGEMKSATCTDISSLTETDNLTGWYYTRAFALLLSSTASRSAATRT